MHMLQCKISINLQVESSDNAEVLYLKLIQPDVTDDSSVKRCANLATKNVIVTERGTRSYMATKWDIPNYLSQRGLFDRQDIQLVFL
jgi:hypothetical protein